MATEILFPRLGFSMNDGTLTEWLVRDGSEVSEGQPLYTLESEKSTVEIESPASGRLRIGTPAGTTCLVGQVLGEIS